MREPIVVCALIPRLALAVAVGGREGLLGQPAALAPEPGAVQQVGEVSLAAEAYGIHRGMRLGEALARCPRLALVPPDPVGVADRWEQHLRGLESIGAAVEEIRPGLACFDARGLQRMYGGRPEGVLNEARRVLGSSARFGVAPTRFAAIAAASQARVRRPVLVGSGESSLRAFLAPLPVTLLRACGDPDRDLEGGGLREGGGRDAGKRATSRRREPITLAELPPVLRRLGIETLGELAELPAAAVADRFGAVGTLAHRLARGQDGPLRPRVQSESLHVSLELPEAAGGLQLEHAVGLLVDRLLARPERRGRALRAAVLSAALVEGGGTWRERVTFREALSDPVRMRIVLVPRLALVPAPVRSLRLVAEGLVPASGRQRCLLQDQRVERAARLREAIRQARSVAGPDAALRVLTVDGDSRIPERRAVLTPFEG
jgi:protein ImuB